MPGRHFRREDGVDPSQAPRWYGAPEEIQWHLNTLAARMTATWYVTFEVRKRGILPKQRSPRETKTFATEAEAKAFARPKHEEGLPVFAGTINPHSPNNSFLRHASMLGLLTNRGRPTRRSVETTIEHAVVHMNCARVLPF